MRIDVCPIAGARPAEPRYVEVKPRRDELEQKRHGPQREPRAARGESAGEPEQSGDGQPDQDTIEIAPQRLRSAAHRPDEEQCAPDLHRRVCAGEGCSMLAECDRNRRREHQPRQHQRQQARADRHPFRIEPVRHPRREYPNPPDRDQQQRDLRRPDRIEAREQSMRKLRDREHEHQIEEQLDHGDPAAVVAAARAQQCRMRGAGVHGVLRRDSCAPGDLTGLPFALMDSPSAIIASSNGSRKFVSEG